MILILRDSNIVVKLRKFEKSNDVLCLISGNICAGNLSKYIPFIMAEIQKNPRRQYLLLHSLKEVKIHNTCIVQLHDAFFLRLLHVAIAVRD